MVSTKLKGRIKLGCMIATALLIGVFGMNWLVAYSARSKSDQSTAIHQVLGDPYIWITDAEHPTDTIYRGKIFFVHNRYIRTETCHVMVTNLWIEPDLKIAHHHSIFSNWFNAGIYELNEYFEVPDQLPAGKWHIIKKTVNYCNGQIYYTTNYDIAVNIVDAPESK